jgi:hypothetical protein
VRARMPQEAHDHLQGCHRTEVRARLLLAGGKREEGSDAPDSPQGHKASQMSGKYSPKSLLENQVVVLLLSLLFKVNNRFWGDSW